MYQDPKRVRKTRVSTNLDDYEAALVQALVDYTGEDRSTLLRQMLIAQLETVLLPTESSMPVTTATSEAQLCAS
jgi:hypothetical protein